MHSAMPDFFLETTCSLTNNKQTNKQGKSAEKLTEV